MTLAVRSALNFAFFKPANLDMAVLAIEARQSNSVTARCQKWGPQVPDRMKNVKVGLKSTSNLITHLKKHHGIVEAEEFKRWLEQSREDFVTRNLRRSGETRMARKPNARSLQKRFESALLNLVARSTIPLRLVEQEAFRDLLDVLHFKRLGLKHVSRRTLGRRVDAAHIASMANLREVLRKAEWVSTTADIWSGRTKSFLGMTVNWTDNDFKRQSAALLCRRFSGTHSYDRIAELVHQIHKSFGLSASKITATVTDNASNFIKAFKVFEVDVANFELQSDQPRLSMTINPGLTHVH